MVNCVSWNGLAVLVVINLIEGDLSASSTIAEASSLREHSLDRQTKRRAAPTIVLIYSAKSLDERTHPNPVHRVKWVPEGFKLNNKNCGVE